MEKVDITTATKRYSQIKFLNYQHNCFDKYYNFLEPSSGRKHAPKFLKKERKEKYLKLLCLKDKNHDR